MVKSHVSNTLSASNTLGVMPGLDPGIHEAAQREQHYGLRSQRIIMDCRVKPGNDVERAEPKRDYQARR